MVFAIFAFIGLFASASRAASIPAETSLLDQGYRAMYNLDFDGRTRTFGEFEDSSLLIRLGRRRDAAAYLFSEFERLKVLRSEFFAEDKSFLGAPKLKADPAMKALLKKRSREAGTCLRQMLKEGKTPERAMFASVCLHRFARRLSGDDRKRKLAGAE